MEVKRKGKYSTELTDAGSYVDKDGARDAGKNKMFYVEEVEQCEATRGGRDGGACVFLVVMVVAVVVVVQF